MTFRDAAIEVLKTSGRLMTTREIAAEAIARKLVSTRGSTPEATMSAALYGLVASPSNPGVQRLAEKGPTRARRGSVRWVWRP